MSNPSISSALETIGSLSVLDRESLARGLATFADGAPIGIALGDTNGRLVYVNDEFLRIVGRTRQEARDLRWDQITPRDWLPVDRQAIHRFQQSGRCSPYEKEFLRPDGTRVPVIIGFTACTPDRSHAVTFVLDQRERAETLERLRQVLGSITEAQIVVDRDSRLLEINAAAERLLFGGRSAAEFLGKYLWTEFPQTANTEFSRHYERAFRENRAMHFEAFSKLAGRWLETHVYPRGDRLEVYLRDITDRKQAEADLAQREATLRTFFNSSPVPMGIVELHDGSDDILHVHDNVATAGFFGNPPGATDGRWATTLGAPAAVIATWLKHYREAQQTREPVRFDYLHKTPAREQWLSATVAYIGETRPGAARFCYVAEDITQRKLHEEALRASEERFRTLSETLDEQVRLRTAELEDANAQLEGFAYSVSHDLRAPLRAMEGFSDALVEDYAESLPPQAQEYLGRIGRAARRLDTMIQDLLAYSRISRNDLPAAPFAVDEAVHEALALCAGEIAARQADVHAAPCPGRVLGHRPTVVQALANLLLNALKFVPPGKTPAVRVWCEARDGGVWRVWVEDNGIGIAPEHHERIFHTFERLHGNEAYPGTGIGLAVVRRGIARMGGHSGVESELGAGSRFWIELPAAKEPGS